MTTVQNTAPDTFAMSQGELLTLLRDQCRDLSARNECAADVLLVALDLLDRAITKDTPTEVFSASQLIRQTHNALCGTCGDFGKQELAISLLQQAAG